MHVFCVARRSDAPLNFGVSANRRYAWCIERNYRHKSLFLWILAYCSGDDSWLVIHTRRVAFTDEKLCNTVVTPLLKQAVIPWIVKMYCYLPLNTGTKSGLCFIPYKNMLHAMMLVLLIIEYDTLHARCSFLTCVLTNRTLCDTNCFEVLVPIAWTDTK